MTQLIFRYSDIYDRMIASWLGKEWRRKFAKKGRDYATEIQKKWDKINNKVFSAYKSFGFSLPDWWLAYPVTGWEQVIPFSDPLTFYISHDWDSVFSTLIHELGHVELTYYENEELTNKISKYVKNEFSHENHRTQIHIPVNVLQLCVVAKVFPKKYEKLIASEKSFKRLKRAWAIIDSQSNKINLENPVQSILALTTPIN